MNAATKSLSGLLLVALVASAARAGEAPILFADVSQAAGMALQPRSQHPNVKVREGAQNFQDVYEKGYFWNIADVCFADVNGDGNLDVFMLNSPHCLWSRLWLGDGKGGFVEVPARRLGPHMRGNFWRLLTYDFRGNGAQDLILTAPFHGWDYKSYSSDRLRFSDPRQKDPEKALMERTGTWTAGYTLLLADFDNDGCVDFATGPSLGRDNPEGESVLQGGILVDGEVTLDRAIVPVPVGCQAVAADFDDDGLVDILARGHWTRPQLMRNLGKRHFADVTEGSGLEKMPSGGPVAVADFNNDGRLDIFCTGCGNPGGARLFLNQGKNVFKDVTEGSGLAPAGKKDFGEKFGGATVADFDNDGLLDLLICDGNQNRLYHNLGNGRFEDVTEAAGLPRTAMKESSNAGGDIDADGRVDLLLITAERGIALFRNTTANNYGWVKVRVHGSPGNPEAAGAKVLVYRDGKLGDNTALLGYQERICATELRSPDPLHFGLGSNIKCDLRVIFPGGSVVDHRGVESGRCVDIRVPQKESGR